MASQKSGSGYVTHETRLGSNHSFPVSTSISVDIGAADSAESANSIADVRTVCCTLPVDADSRAVIPVVVLVEGASFHGADCLEEMDTASITDMVAHENHTFNGWSFPPLPGGNYLTICSIRPLIDPPASILSRYVPVGSKTPPVSRPFHLRT